MANIKGGRAARKRDRQNAKANKRNSSVKTRLHDDHKNFFSASSFLPASAALKSFL